MTLLKFLLLAAAELKVQSQEDKNDDIAETMQALTTQFPKVGKKDAVLIMAHGTPHPANAYYAVMQDKEDRDLSYGSFCKKDAFIECKEMNDRYEEEGKPREAFVAEIYNPTEISHEYKDNEVLCYLNSVEANKKEEEANKSDKNMKQTEKEDEEEI